MTGTKNLKIHQIRNQYLRNLQKIILKHTKIVSINFFLFINDK